MFKASLKELASALDAKKVSSLELTNLFLGRIAQHNPTINAFVTIDEEKSRAAAKAADAARADEESHRQCCNDPVTWHVEPPIRSFVRP